MTAALVVRVVTKPILIFAALAAGAASKAMAEASNKVRFSMEFPPWKSCCCVERDTPDLVFIPA
jgi:hypothetical protein